ncbi:uncharacterized protein LOC135157826 isoform X2 [Lytechinus pictus]|uniref:uncharacterized protein LOC135157826 isoform X2 n=1 Tax=Lytechinus pictus TaxID=7653 RepID=UPI0030B9DCE1
MPTPASDEFFCLFEFESDDSVEIGPFSWILDTDKDVDPESYVDQAVEVMWDPRIISSEKGTRCVTGNQWRLIRKLGEGRERRNQHAHTCIHLRSWRRMMRSLNQKKTKKSKSKISQCNEMARDLRKQMFGANETKKSNGRTATGSGTSGEIIDLKKQLEKSRRETEDLQVKLTKEKAVREKIQQQLLFLQGVPKFIETFKGFIVDMEEMSRLKADHEEMHCPSGGSSTSSSPARSSPARSSTQSSTQSSPSSARPQSQQIALGSKVSLSRNVLDRCNAGDFRKYTCDLMLAVFGRPTLLTSSLTGAKNVAGRAKPPLDSDKLQGIISHVKSKFPGVSSSEIRIVMRNKVGNEIKLAKRRSQPKENQAKENQAKELNQEPQDETE